MTGISDDYCSMFAEAITCLDAKVKEQSEVQLTQALDIRELKRKVSVLDQQDFGTRISKMIDVATKVSMMKLDDKIQEGHEKLQLIQIFPNSDEHYDIQEWSSIQRPER